MRRNPAIASRPATPTQAQGLRLSTRGVHMPCIIDRAGRGLSVPGGDNGGMAKVAAPVRVAVVVLLVLALAVAVIWLLQRRLIYFPDRSAPPPAPRVVAGAQDVTVRTS